MKCALKTDSANESASSPEPRASILITTFLHCSENDCMQITCTVHAVTNLWHSGVLGSRSSGPRFCEMISPSSRWLGNPPPRARDFWPHVVWVHLGFRTACPCFSVRHSPDHSRLMLHRVHLAIIRPHGFCECRNYHLHHSC